MCKDERTITGRKPSAPELQNIPIRTPEGRRMREAFTPACVFGIDYAQLERRVLAFSQASTKREIVRVAKAAGATKAVWLHDEIMIEAPEHLVSAVSEAVSAAMGWHDMPNPSPIMAEA